MCFRRKGPLVGEKLVVFRKSEGRHSCKKMTQGHEG